MVVKVVENKEIQKMKQLIEAWSKESEEEAW